LGDLHGKISNFSHGAIAVRSGRYNRVDVECVSIDTIATT